MAFECKHCGKCCTDIASQININLGDIIRIAKFLNAPIDDVLKKVGMKPFAEPENDNKYTVELGLNIPCQFRVGKSCSIYPARPLNCRIFPYFIMGGAPNEMIKQIIDPSHKCIVEENTNYTDEEKTLYKKYTSYIGEIILKESKITETFLDRYGLRQKISIPASHFPTIDNNNILAKKQIAIGKINMAIEMINTPENLNKLIQNFITKTNLKKDTVSFEEINKNSI